jgi:hypothetical protein
MQPNDGSPLDDPACLLANQMVAQLDAYEAQTLDWPLLREPEAEDGASDDTMTSFRILRHTLWLLHRRRAAPCPPGCGGWRHVAKDNRAGLRAGP